jgi:DUF4097 and DUF4098 domain-containing protein YvlB
MSSNAPIPPRQRRSFAGPVVLIILGVLFLLGTMGVLHWENMGRLFAHYWPVLLILWGIIKLLEYYEAQRQGLRPRGIGAGGVFLMIVLIIFGLGATQAAHFNWGELRNQIDLGDNDFPLFGHTYTYDDQLSQDFPAGASLHIVNDRGAINVTASGDNQIHVAVHKRVNAEDQEDADKWNAGTKPRLSASGQMVSLDANIHGAGDHWIAADMDISLPRAASVVVTSRRGDVSVLGRTGDVEISNQHGDVSASDVSGKVALHLEDSSARVSQVGSDVTIEGRANDVSVQDVKGTAHLNGDFMESVKLSRIARGATFKSSRTEMDFARVDGDIDLDSGDLQASSVTGPVRIATRSKDVRLDGLSGDLRLEDQNGAVEVHVARLGNLQIENRQGDIEVYLPEKAAFQLDARARNGEIQSDFDGLKIDNGDDQAIGTGSVGSGGAHLVISNEHGTIELHRGSALAEVPAPPVAPKAPRVPAPPKVPNVTEN